MDYMNVEELIRCIKSRPKMYVEEIRIDYIYYLLAGYIGCGLKTQYSEDIDKVFKKEFSNWLSDWVSIYLKKDFKEKGLSWYHIFQIVTTSQEEAVNLFYIASEKFFAHYHKNHQI